MSEIKLLSCPLCGGEVVLQEIEPHTHVLAKFMPDCKGEVIIECKCGCSIMRSTKAEAIEAWNTRKPIEDMVEQLTEHLEDIAGYIDDDIFLGNTEHISRQLI